MVATTYFQHRDQHTATWLSNTGKLWAAIDHILVSRGFAHSVRNARVLPTATAHHSDHRVVVCEMRLRLKANRPRTVPPPRLNMEALTEPETAQAYARAVESAFRSHLQAHPEAVDNTAEVERMHAALREAAGRTAGLAPRTAPSKPWISAHTRALSEGKRTAFEAWRSARGTDGEAAARTLYAAANKATRNSAKADHDRWVRKQTREIGALLEGKQLHQAYKLINKLAGRRVAAEVTALRLDAGGETAYGPDVARVFGQHWQRVLHCPASVDAAARAQLAAVARQQPVTGEGADVIKAAACVNRAPPAAPAPTAPQAPPEPAPPAQTRVPPGAPPKRAPPTDGSEPSMEEVAAALRLLRNTAPQRHDGITAPLLKRGGPAAVSWLHRIIIQTRAGAQPVEAV